MLVWVRGRDVFLLAKPAIHISDFFVRTPLTFSSAGALESAGCAALLATLHWCRWALLEAL